jgi:hypothetical protein
MQAEEDHNRTIDAGWSVEAISSHPLTGERTLSGDLQGHWAPLYSCLEVCLLSCLLHAPFPGRRCGSLCVALKRISGPSWSQCVYSPASSLARTRKPRNCALRCHASKHSALAHCTIDRDRADSSRHRRRRHAHRGSSWRRSNLSTVLGMNLLTCVCDSLRTISRFNNNSRAGRGAARTIRE